MVGIEINRGDMSMFREVLLSGVTTGRLFLHSMPARYESWDEFRDQIEITKINRIVCLAEAEEIKQKSPSYFDAIASHLIPCPKLDFPIPDFGTPVDCRAFAECVQLVAGYIESGETVLIHCAGGIGRTGTFATCVLHCLGMKNDMATRLVHRAGSDTETREQSDLVCWHAMIASK
jgi:protein-tyrosine phosphatase